MSISAGVIDVHGDRLSSGLKRTAISYATITLDVKQYTEDSKVHIDISQELWPGNIKGTTELRTLDWQWRAHSDHVFVSTQITPSAAPFAPHKRADQLCRETSRGEVGR